jgi:hypothetical protein
MNSGIRKENTVKTIATRSIVKLVATLTLATPLAAFLAASSWN